MSCRRSFGPPERDLVIQVEQKPAQPIDPKDPWAEDFRALIVVKFGRFPDGGSPALVILSGGSVAGLPG